MVDRPQIASLNDFRMRFGVFSPQRIRENSSFQVCFLSTFIDGSWSLFENGNAFFIYLRLGKTYSWGIEEHLISLLIFSLIWFPFSISQLLFVFKWDLFCVFQLRINTFCWSLIFISPIHQSIHYIVALKLESRSLLNELFLQRLRFLFNCFIDKCQQAILIFLTL